MLREAAVSLDPELLTGEFRTLRKGRGVLEEPLRTRLGSQLVELCQIAGQTDGALIRQRVGDTLARLADELPADLRLAVRTALAITPEARYRFLTERVSWLATKLNIDDRTARRRIDVGFQLLVEQAVRHESLERNKTPYGGRDTCYVEFFRGVLRLDAPAPRLLE